jgi:hypothetical protein
LFASVASSTKKPGQFAIRALASSKALLYDETIITRFFTLLQDFNNLRLHHLRFDQVKTIERLLVFEKPGKRSNEPEIPLLGNRLRLFSNRHRRLFAQGILVLRITLTMWANRARWENWGLAVRANFTGQCITLFFKSPVTRNFHFDFILSQQQNKHDCGRVSALSSLRIPF